MTTPTAHLRTAAFYRRQVALARTPATRGEALRHHHYFLGRARDLNATKKTYAAAPWTFRQDD